MKLGRVMAVVLAGASLVLLAWVYVVAQQPRSPGGTIVPAPDVPFNPSSAGSSSSLEPAALHPNLSLPPGGFVPRVATESSGNAYQSFPPPSRPGADLSLLSVKVELRKGLVLDGQIAVTGPLVCATAFGEAAIPLAAIRGIRLHDEQTATGTERPAPQATIVLTNNDSLTVSLRAAQIQVKTEWGEVNINVPHLKSMLLTSDDVQWQKANGRWTLVAVEKPPPAAADASEIAPPASTRDDPNAAGSLPPPRLTVPPLDTRPTVPSLPAIPGPIEPPGPT